MILSKTNRDFNMFLCSNNSPLLMLKCFSKVILVLVSSYKQSALYYLVALDWRPCHLCTWEAVLKKFNWQVSTFYNLFNSVFFFDSTGFLHQHLLSAIYFKCKSSVNVKGFYLLLCLISHRTLSLSPLRIPWSVHKSHNW